MLVLGFIAISEMRVHLRNFNFSKLGAHRRQSAHVS